MNTIIDQLQEIYPSDFDLYLFHEGTLYESYKMLGAHFVTSSGKTGVRFAVWAPHAKQVSVVGNFNNWDGNDHAMERIERSGIWVLFVWTIWVAPTLLVTYYIFSKIMSEKVGKYFSVLYNNI